jgi:hypothetical protein
MTRGLAFLSAFVLFTAGIANSQSIGSPPGNRFWTNGPAVYQVSNRVVTNVVPPPPLSSYKPPPLNLPVEVRRGLMLFLAQGTLRAGLVEDRIFDHYLPESLNDLVLTNVLAHTNGRNTLIWSKRSHTPSWPAEPPIVQWNTNNIMWGMKGLTGLSPCWEGEGNPGQVPVTALTRRHGYARGHSMGPDGFRTLFAGKRVWFLTTDSGIIETRVLREVVRATDPKKGDYTILLFDRDLPSSIEPLRVMDPTVVFGLKTAKYAYFTDALAPLFKTEQTGHVSADLPGFTVNVFKGGDSGSPNMLPLPGELIFWNGRITSGASPQMQQDMDALCKMEGFDPAKYQMRWADLSAFPTYQLSGEADRERAP